MCRNGYADLPVWARVKAHFLLLLVVVGAAAGCLRAPERLLSCDGPAEDVTLFLSPEGLVAQAPAEGAVPVGDFTQAFLTDDLLPFDSAPLADGALILGDVTLELWVTAQGAPAPLALGDPGDGYHLFNQFGSDRALQPAYAVEYAEAAAPPGTVWHYVEPLTMPPGGFVVEGGDAVRVLVTSLATAGPTDRGHHVLVGGDTPSQVRFRATCYAARAWTSVQAESAEVSIPGHQGLLTGAVPPREGFNVQTVWFDLLPLTQRLTVTLRQGDDANPVKDDMDLVLVDADGTPVWNAGSPWADETAVLWEGNLRAAMPPGHYGVRVNSYSGHAYEGSVSIVQERA